MAELSRRLTVDESRQVLLTGMLPGEPETLSESRFQARILTYAKAHGWKGYHTYDSRGSAPGFPDLVLARGGHPGRLLFVEDKRTGGKVTPAQQEWLEILRHTVPGVEVYVWEPQDWPEILRILT